MLETLGMAGRSGGIGFRNAPAKELAAPESVFGKLPLYFVESRAQSGDAAAYQTLGGDHQAHFTATGVWLTQTQAARRDTDPAQADFSPLRRVALHREPSQSWALKLEFLGAREVAPLGVAPAETKVSDFRGKPERWRTGLATHTELVYPDLWSGIDLRYGGDKGRLKSTFTVKPGADPGRIRLAWRGAERVALTDSGRLRVETPLGVIEEERPVAWQEREGRRVPVSARYALETDPAGGWRYGFALGEYDPALPLVIDPVTLGYSGFLGGNHYDVGFGIAVDGTGAAYVTGATISSDFPITVGEMNGSQSGDADAFVVKVKPDGSGLAYAGVFGGSGGEGGTSIAVDGTGAAYVTGQTDSSDFPAVGGLGAALKGSFDIFVVKVKPDGSGLAYAGLLGGGSSDYSSGIAVDGTGAAYVTGWTGSSDFPAVGGLGAALKGSSDAFVVKVKPDGSGLAYTGVLGGSASDSGSAIAVDGTGAAYITGQTGSSDFPAVGGLGAALKGVVDIFVVKVKPDGSGLAYAGVFGGTGGGECVKFCPTEYGTGIAVDSAGAAYVTGRTDLNDFPAVGGLGAALKGSPDIFVVKVKPDGSGLAYAGLLGGGSSDYSSGIAVDGTGAAYVTGWTDSSDFPAVGGLGAAPTGSSDAFVVKVKPDGSGLAYTGVLGGSASDSGSAIAVDSAGTAYIVGNTSSNDFPVVGGPDLSYNGISDAFVAKIVETAAPIPPIAVSDRYSSYTDQLPVTVAAPGVLRNDLNSDGGTLTASVIDAPRHGALRLDADGGFTYTPNRDGGSMDSFTYKASNSVGDSASATVTVELMQPPKAVRDRVDIWSGGGFGNVLSNDMGIVFGVTTAIIQKQPRHGTLALEPNGNFTYTPNPGYQGRDSFTYAIKYGSATSKPARVTLIVR